MAGRLAIVLERMSWRGGALLWVLAVVVLASCGGGQATVPATSPVQAVSDAPAATAPPPATPTAEPTSTATPVPSATPTATATETPSPTPTPLHPMSIAYLRQQSYPGSDLVIEQTLNPGANYDRYVASYLSEGLKIYGLLTVPRGERPESGWPIIVFLHGYIPPDVYRTTERYVAYQDAFARNGYITLKPDYRGHGSSEGNPSGGIRGPDYTIDALNAVASLKRHPDADPERLQRAAEIACASEFIDSRPEGWDAPVGERGAGLSGGQRQRIAIARAVAARPDVIILDDVTSSLDLATEQSILAALYREFRSRTGILISQKIQTLRGADRIAVMENGRITAVGRHEELLESNATYRTIFETQSGEAPGVMTA